jgi:hypothetical protein
MEAGVGSATPMLTNVQGSVGEEGGGGYKSEWVGRSAV